jgi:hypothetical protein
MLLVTKSKGLIILLTLFCDGKVTTSLVVITLIAFAELSLLCITSAGMPTILHKFSLLKVGQINHFFT